MVYDELKKPEEERKTLPVDEDLPGMGQYYCLHCEYVSIIYLFIANLSVFGLKCVEWKWFLFGFIHVKLGWTINSRLKSITRSMFGSAVEKIDSVKLIS